MRIGILTHPQGINYGGILQCYALSVYLRQMGHEPFIIRREIDDSNILWKSIRSILRVLHCPRYYQPTPKLDTTLAIKQFINKYINRTKPITSQKQIKNICEQYNLQAVIVGSDQVWRKSFALRYGYNYFLDFVPDKTKKIAYAASFGSNEWEYTDTQTKHIKKLLTLYNSISVREDSAKNLIKEHIGINVNLMIDPTLLHKTEEYDKICSPRLVNTNYIFVYWLGEKNIISPIIAEYQHMGMHVVYIGLREQCVMPAIEDWISYIKHAECILTDSFHGCIFSILYNRPLKIYENKSGGFQRIISLLHLLGLKEQDTTKLSQQDFQEIEIRLSYLRNEAKHFFEESLITKHS